MAEQCGWQGVVWGMVPMMMGLLSGHAWAAVATFEADGAFLRDVYVSTDGSDSVGDGSSSAPYATLDKALAGYQPGDHIHLAAGVYSGGLYYTGIQGSAANPVKIEGPETGEALFLTTGAENLHLVQPHYLILRNLSFAGAGGEQINIDDAGSITDPAQYLVLDNIVSRDMNGADNNADLIKMAGVDHFYILNSTLSNVPGSQSSALDLVGCHEGVIANNIIRDAGHTLIQAKGGSADITIYGNTLSGAGERAIQMGGSTGGSFFRPSLASGTDYEARNITIIANTISDSAAAVAYTGAVDCVVSNNVIYRPLSFVYRILQESTVVDGYTLQAANNGTFRNNIIVFPSSLSALVNIGSNTAAQTFTMNNNLWYCNDNPDYSYGQLDQLPMTMHDSLRQIDPGLVDPGNGDFHLLVSSEARDRGEAGVIVLDMDGQPYRDDIGADEYYDGAVPPVIQPIGDQVARANQPYTGPTPILSQGESPISWLLVDGPDGMGIDSDSGVVTWPNPQPVGGWHSVTIQASNSGGVDTESWQVRVVEDLAGGQGYTTAPALLLLRQ